MHFPKIKNNQSINKRSVWYNFTRRTTEEDGTKYNNKIGKEQLPNS